MPTARPYSVSFTDAEGITHTVEVTASSLFEAAVLALAEFRGAGVAVIGPGTKLTVRPRSPEISHTVSVGRLRSWLDGSGKGPNKHALKSRLKGVFPVGS